MNSPKPWPDPTPVDGELLGRLRTGVIEYNEASVTTVCQTIIDRGMDAYMAIFEGLVAGMDEVGRLFDRREYFVPELLMCADALYAGLHMLRPYVRGGIGSQNSKGPVIFGTIEGDIHDIGKNLVKMVFEIAGFTIRDLGSDTPIARFVKETVGAKSPLVCVSMMMTTCLPRLKELVEKINTASPGTLVMIGGASITDDTVETIGASGTAKDAHHALRGAIGMLSAAHTLKVISHEPDRRPVT